MSGLSRHTEWLSLVDVSGAFLALPVLEKAFPQGLDIVETPRRQHLRAAYEEWRDAVDEGDPLLPELHREWIRLVFTQILEYDTEILKAEADVGSAYTVASPERTETFSPDWVVVSPSDTKPRMFVSLQSPGTDLEKVRKDDRWPVSLRDRMTALCRVHGVRLGLLTNGERWMLVNAPSGATSGDASWYARLWFQEPVTLKAFQSLLGVRRCFGPTDETLDALLAESLEHHEEITDTLGAQVRRAVEVLVQCLDKADMDRNRELLRDVSPSELYEAGLTVMMRLVFVLCAEERGLLLSGDPVYDECYAVSTLRGQLAEEADRHGPEVLERRHDAWARLLSVFRAVHGGIDHESLRMPALGGSLFDPDRFPFLEGRQKGTTWRDSDATPLPIDNRTVLLLLNSLQSIEQYGGAMLLSYRALDVEQIGHVYEGLLEHTVARVPSVTLGLAGSKGAKNPNLTLSELESARMDGEETLVALITETTSRSRSAIVNALARPVEEAAFGLLLSVCGGDTTLAKRIRPFANLLRMDAWGDPIVYRGNTFMVTLGADRRETGTHYTPKSLTETIVESTLEPIVYVGPAEGKPRDEWCLKAPSELLDLKVCDPAMGSGAFLVQACRWLAERLVESWTAEETVGKFVTADGDVLDTIGTTDPMPTDMEERLLTARRLIAERCLYGVDVNPLAVELAKLSIWLCTLAKGRPFGFLDHNLRSGDSLVGIHRLDQLTTLKMNPSVGRGQQCLFGQNIKDAVADAVKIRKQLRSTPIRDIRDVETMALLDSEARNKVEGIGLVADAMIGKVLTANGSARAVDSALDSLVMQVGAFLSGDVKMKAAVQRDVCTALAVDVHGTAQLRKPFHWPLEFPEVIDRGGFNAIVSNPPFIPITGMDWNTRRYIETQYSCAVGRHNTFSSFAERALAITNDEGNLGMVVPDRLLLNIQYELLRNLLFQNLSFSKIIDYTGAFKATVDTIAIIGHKSRSDDTINVIHHLGSSGESRKKSFRQSALRAAFDGAINIYVEPEDTDIYSTVKKQSIPLGDIADVKDGIIQGAVADLLFIDGPCDKYSHKILFGADVTRYKISWGRKYVNYNIEELMKTEIERRGPKVRPGLWMRNSEIFERKKIITRQTADRIIGAIDIDNHYYANTLHGTSLNEEGIKRGYSLEFVLALLNSKLINYLYAVITGEAGKVFAQIKIETFKRLPIYSVLGSSTAMQLSNLAKEAATRTSYEQEDILNEIDRLTFKLYGLEKDVIDFVNNRCLVFWGK